MNIPKTIKQLRQKRKLKQSEVNVGKSSSKLSRIENSEQSINIDELNQIIGNLGFSHYEFFHFASMNDYANNFSLKIRRAALNPDDHILKEHLLKVYFDEQFKFSYSSKDLACYYALKVTFESFWELGKIKNDELVHIYKHLKKQSYFGYYEYLLFLNVGPSLSKEKMLKLANLMYPIEDESHRDQFTKKYALSGLINSVSKLMYNKNYADAMRLIEVSRKVDVDNTDYYFRLSIKYLENILLYFQTEDPNYLRKVYNLIELIEDIGDTEIAKLISEEVRKLLTQGYISNNDLPTTLIKDR